ncbi:MAG: ATP-binding protein [Verrucomicrobia bacterium]|nr:ATP-binding protein [Verrucomicrobiota bacterium]
MKPDAARSLSSRWTTLLAVLTAVAGIGLSLHLRSRIAKTEANEVRLTAESLRLNTEQELTLFAEVLESVCALHALSSEVNQAAMDEFIEKGLVYQHAILGPFGLAQRITPQLRAEIERKDKPGPGAYTIVQQGPGGSWVPAELQSEYYPLTWQSHSGELKIPVGFDFASHPVARQTIRQIEQTRRPALVPAAVPQRTEDRHQRTESGNRKSSIDNSRYWVFAPVIPHQIAPNPLYVQNAVIGFAVAVLSPEIILNRVTPPSGLSPGLKLNLMNPAEPVQGESIRRAKGLWLYRRPLEVVGAQWVFECSLPISATGHRSATALIIGLIITALMTSQLLILGNRTRKIEAEVLARTEDLRIANARLEENLHDRASLEEEMNELAARERRRIGRDLHDSLGQKLTGAVFLSRSLFDHFKSGGSDQQTHAKTLNETLKAAVGQVRNMARGLAPVTLNDESLGEALEQLSEEMTGLYGVSCEVAECAALPALDQKTKEQLYLIAREAVNNAARHAQAGRITIQLTGNESGWTMRIEDDGKGLIRRRQGHGGQAEQSDAVEGSPCSVPEALLQGMGIRIMRHRASLIGAAFTLTSAPGQGTSVDVTSNT